MKVVQMPICILQRLIESGHPPDNWKTLLKEAKQESKRLQDTLEKSGEATG